MVAAAVRTGNAAVVVADTGRRRDRGMDRRKDRVTGRRKDFAKDRRAGRRRASTGGSANRFGELAGGAIDTTDF